MMAVTRTTLIMAATMMSSVSEKPLARFDCLNALEFTATSGATKWPRWGHGAVSQ
jgi:hypothetical protein